jgi:hypothetical protein
LLGALGFQDKEYRNYNDHQRPAADEERELLVLLNLFD